MTSADEFRITRRFAAPRARLWQAWTDPAALARWFGPKGTVTTMLAHDLRPGGRLHARMDNPDGHRLWARFDYREVAPTRRLVWAHGFADAAGDWAASPFGGPWPEQLLTTVLFEDAGDATQVTLTWVPLDAAEDQIAAFRAMIPSMTQGWGGSFDQLAHYLAAPA